MSEQEHAPCPFCGGTDLATPPLGRVVVCGDCRCAGPFVEHPHPRRPELTQLLAYSKWDTRPPAPKAILEKPCNLNLVADFLDDLAERQGNAGCNDLLLTNTAEHRAIWEAASDEADMDADWPPPETEAVFYAVDFVVVHYLAAQAREAAQAAKEQKNAPEPT